MNFLRLEILYSNLLFRIKDLKFSVRLYKFVFFVGRTLVLVSSWTWGKFPVVFSL